MDVLEEDRRRVVGGEGLEHLDDLAQHAVSRDAEHPCLEHLELGGVDEPGHLGEPGRRPGAKRVDEPCAVGSSAEPPESLEHGHVRLAGAAVLDALAPPDRHGRVEAREERPDERGLADARLAAHEHEPPLALRHPREDPAECVELRLAAHDADRRPGVLVAVLTPRSGADGLIRGTSRARSWRRMRRSSSRSSSDGPMPSSSSSIWRNVWYASSASACRPER